MPTMEVDIIDTLMKASALQPGANSWQWPINWEYVNLTVIPIFSNSSVTVTSVFVTTDAESHRTLHYNFNINPPLVDCFATLTLPHDSVD
jgi:hypothetical protein